MVGRSWRVGERFLGEIVHWGSTGGLKRGRERGKGRGTKGNIPSGASVTQLCAAVWNNAGTKKGDWLWGREIGVDLCAFVRGRQ